MKEEIKKIIFGYLPGFITGLIVCGGISVIAATYFPSNDVTYDNKESGLVSTDVQGAIDELYTECTKEPTAGETIIENAGLEKDPYECRYFFTGGNPNNYITFNDEKALWAIISVECDGRIKIMRQEVIGEQSWDNSGLNDWARPASLNTYLNDTYYNKLLNSTAQSQIVTSNFSIGAIEFENNNLLEQINDESSKKWDGKIALPTVSEIIRTNSNKSDCGTFQLMNNNISSCANTGWMDNGFYTISHFWTISSEDNDLYNTFFAQSNGYVSKGFYLNLGVKPVLYLSPNVKIVSGSGTRTDPYVVS